MEAAHGRIATQYSLIQALYWITYCLMINFAGVFLLDKGLSSGEIGLVLGLCYLFSACLQPMIGVAFSKIRLRLNQCAAGVYLLVAALSVGALLFPTGRTGLKVQMIAIFSLQSMMQPTINSLSKSFEGRGVRVNFGLARGIGSLSFAMTCLAVGQLLKRVAPSMLPCFYLATVCALILLLLLLLYRAPEQHRESDAPGGGVSYREMLCGCPHLTFFLLGVTGLFITHEFIETFLIQILISIGGNSANLGIATMLSSITELPAMVLYARFSRRRRGRGYKLLWIAGWLWVIKDLLTMVAPTPQVLYAVQLMHFVTNAIYVPAMMDFVSRTLPGSMFIRAVALAGTANTLGCLLGSALGGWLLDRMALRPAFLAMQAFSVLGAICLTIAIRRARGTEENRGPSESGA